MQLGWCTGMEQFEKDRVKKRERENKKRKNVIFTAIVGYLSPSTSNELHR